MTKQKILSIVSNSKGPIPYTSLMNHGLLENKPDPIHDKMLIQELINENYLHGETRAFCSISITYQGRMYYQKINPYYKFKKAFYAIYTYLKQNFQYFLHNYH